MPRPQFLLVAILFLPSAFVIAEDRGPNQPIGPQVVHTPDAAGEAVNGLRLRLKRVPEQWYVVGDQFSLPLAFQNETDHAFDLLLQYYVPSVEVMAIDDQGHRVQIAPPTPMIKNPGPTWHTVRAGGKLPRELHVERAVQFSEPGRYRLWCSYNLEASEKEVRGRRAPKTMPYLGTVISNVVEITLISHEEYVRRAEEPDEGDFAGATIMLQPKQAEFSIRDNLKFTAKMKSGRKAGLTVPRSSADIKMWRVADEETYVDATPFTGRKDLLKQKERNETRELQVSTNDEHMRAGLAGQLTYRAELWLRHPSDAAEAAGHSLPPRRIISPKHHVSVVIRDGDVESVLSDAARSWGHDEKRRRHQNPSLDRLCCYLDRIQRELARQNTGDNRQATLARDLLLAAEIKKAIQAHPHPRFTGDAGIVVQGDGKCRLAPAWLGDVNGIGRPVAEPDEFARRFVRLLRCSSYMYGNVLGSNSIPRQLVVDDSTTMDSVGAVCNAVRHEASREDVYIYQMELRLPPKTPGGGFIALTGKDSHYLVSMLVGVCRAEVDARYVIVPYENPDPRPTYFRSWNQQQLGRALDRLAKTELRFASAEHLRSHFDSRQKRHEQIWVVPDQEARAVDVIDAIKVIRTWHSTPVFVADSPPDAARFAD